MKWPSERVVRDRVEAFFQTVHAGDFDGAFELCPVWTYRSPAISRTPKAVKGAREAMKQTLVDWELADLPEDGGGDVLANVFVDREVTDITAIFMLTQQKAEWVLCFKMFKVM